MCLSTPTYLPRWVGKREWAGRQAGGQGVGQKLSIHYKQFESAGERAQYNLPITGRGGNL